MKTVRVVYPFEPGLIWLLRQDGLWGGWRNGKFECDESQMEDIGIFANKCEDEDERVVYRCFFYQVRGENTKLERWKPFTDDDNAAHFDLWGLPQLPLHPLESVFLPDILKKLTQKRERLL